MVNLGSDTCRGSKPDHKGREGCPPGMGRKDRQKKNKYTPPPATNGNKQQQNNNKI